MAPRRKWGIRRYPHEGKKQAIWKSVELRRVDADDLDRIAEVMKNCPRSAIRRLKL